LKLFPNTLGWKAAGANLFININFQHNDNNKPKQQQ